MERQSRTKGPAALCLISKHRKVALEGSGAAPTWLAIYNKGENKDEVIETALGFLLLISRQEIACAVFSLPL
jgi:hypothetical protein